MPFYTILDTMLDIINVINADLKDVVLLLKNPPRSPFTKGGRCCVALYKREMTQFPPFLPAILLAGEKGG
jgi:hypothetical protein